MSVCVILGSGSIPRLFSEERKIHGGCHSPKLEGALGIS
jgi:hypothetical protein